VRACTGEKGVPSATYRQASKGKKGKKARSGKSFAVGEEKTLLRNSKRELCRPLPFKPDEKRVPPSPSAGLGGDKKRRSPTFSPFSFPVGWEGRGGKACLPLISFLKRKEGRGKFFILRSRVRRNGKGVRPSLVPLRTRSFSWWRGRGGVWKGDASVVLSAQRGRREDGSLISSGAEGREGGSRFLRGIYHARVFRGNRERGVRLANRVTTT